MRGTGEIDNAGLSQHARAGLMVAFIGDELHERYSFGFGAAAPRSLSLPRSTLPMELRGISARKRYRPWTLIRREVLFGAFAQVGFKGSRGLVGLGNNEDRDFFAQIRIRHTGNRALTHTGLGFQYGFDLTRRDISSTHNDEFLHPTVNGQIVVCGTGPLDHQCGTSRHRRPPRWLQDCSNTR